MLYETLPNWNFSVPVNLDISNPNNCIFAVEELGEQVLGVVMPRAGGSYKLVVSSGESEVVQRFTNAYLIAEVLAYRPKEKLVVTRENFIPSPSKFRIAHCQRLALAYLMPKAAIEYYILKKKFDGIEQLASAFNVSELAINTRLKLLGVI